MAEPGPVVAKSARGIAIVTAAVVLLDGLGKIWNLPNTILGLSLGVLTLPFGGRLGFGHNAVEFMECPLMDRFAPCGAITLGNVILYGRHAYGLAEHERVHTLQGQFIGPAYLPLNVIGMALSLLSWPVKRLRRPGCGPFHGRLNFMEGHPAKDGLYPGRRP
ncbi:hypothetical protein DFR24_0757 [Panacagrimonas perspica]|uniref:Uncharacterized protein n=1 Tax=Panacagrimonas perspica TaxID=381431 RepID=A0A4R7PCN6_9GAMM|nr:hypothetical protein DFR24_0757 [Panacagrimonas perspica]